MVRIPRISINGRATPKESRPTLSHAIQGGKPTMQLRHKLKHKNLKQKKNGFTGWSYVVALILLLVVIAIVLLLMKNTRTIFLEKMGFIRDLLGIG
jgi:hypothetical protein